MAIFSAIGGALYGIGYAVGFLGAAAGLSTATILTIAGVAGNIAIAATLSAIARALAPKVNVPQSEVQAIISQTDAPRRVYVGQYLAGGIRAFFDVKGNTLYQLVMAAHGSVTEYVAFWIDGEPATVAADGSVTSGDKSGYVNVKTRLGTSLGGNYSDLLNNFSTWNSNRRLQSQATFLVQSRAPKGEDFMKVFPKAYNTSFQWVIKGRAVRDWRTGTVNYSDNAASVIGHYLTSTDGFRLDQPEISSASFSAMEDHADIDVPQLAGGTAKNLRLWGYWTLDEEPSQVLDRMHTSSGIRAYEMQDGRIGLIGGPFGEPACTLTAKDIKEIQTSEAISEREGYNVLQVFHLQPDQKYEVTEVEAWRDEARLAVEGEITQEMRLEMCPNTSQARRLAKKQIHDDNRQKVSLITNLVGLKARWPRYHGQRHTILLDYQPEDGSGRVIQGEYEVLDHEFDPVGLECRIELGRVNRASESWAAAEEGETTADLPDREENPPPGMSAILSQRVIQVSAGVQQPVLEVTALPVAGREDLTIEAQYRRVGDGLWIEMGVSGLRAQAGAIEDGQQYEAQVRWRGVFDGIAPWNSLGPITIRIDATPPAAPTELFASSAASFVTVNWRNPNGNFYNVRVYRGTTSSLANSVLVGTTGGVAGQISEYQDSGAASGTTYYYWVRAANISGVESAATGPASVTKT